MGHWVARSCWYTSSIVKNKLGILLENKIIASLSKVLQIKVLRWALFVKQKMKFGLVWANSLEFINPLYYFLKHMFYHKAASRSTSWLVAQPRIFRLFMKGEIWWLCTVTFVEYGPELKKSPIYSLWLYSRLKKRQSWCCKYINFCFIILKNFWNIIQLCAR